MAPPTHTLFHWRIYNAVYRFHWFFRFSSIFPSRCHAAFGAFWFLRLQFAVLGCWSVSRLQCAYKCQMELTEDDFTNGQNTILSALHSYVNWIVGGIFHCVFFASFLHVVRFYGSTFLFGSPLCFWATLSHSWSTVAHFVPPSFTPFVQLQFECQALPHAAHRAVFTFGDCGI